ncbi:hypothetical protein N9971_00490 [bacterium]|nr:hypothetical protein [bacterium]
MPIQRRVDVSPENVFKALTDPEAGRPQGFDLMAAASSRSSGG